MARFASFFRKENKKYTKINGRCLLFVCNETPEVEVPGFLALMIESLKLG